MTSCLRRVLATSALAFALAAGVIAGIATAPQAQAVTLTVALYPYVPRVDQFRDALIAEWAKVEPSVPLAFIPKDQWDGGYEKDPPATADLFVFDAMFLGTYITNLNLAPLQAAEIANLNDFLPYAKNGVQSGGSYYGIPLLGCTNVLFYFKSDTQLAAAKTLSQVSNVIGQCTYTSPIPPDRRGTMLDLAGTTTRATWYLASAYAASGVFPLPLPDLHHLDAAALQRVQLVLKTASFWDGTTEEPAYQQSRWFSQGYGRSVIGFSESLSVMSPEIRGTVAMKVMPISDNPNERPLFYADVIGVNRTTASRDLAVKLANVMASTPALVASIGRSPTASSPQYLLATRPSAFTELAKQDPIYNELYKLTQTNPQLFSLGDQAKPWIASTKVAMSTGILKGYSCGCDFQAASVIPDQSAANAMCPRVCSDHGGWNGQWTNQPPVVGSVCGCNVCPLSGR